MITTIREGMCNYYEGLSTDSKPKGAGLNGSIFYEMDTGDVYMYDEANDLWRKQ